MWYKKFWTDLSSVLSQSTRSTDRQTDGQSFLIAIVRVGIPCSAETTSANWKIDDADDDDDADIR